MTSHATILCLVLTLYICGVYSQNSLPSLIPTINQINPNKISLTWQTVELAKSYVVKINGKDYSLVSETAATVTFEYGTTNLAVQLVANKCSIEAGIVLYNCVGTIVNFAVPNFPDTDISYYDINDSVFTLVFAGFVPEEALANAEYAVEIFSPITNAWEYEADILLQGFNYYYVNLKRYYPNLPIYYRVRHKDKTSRAIIVPPKVDFTINDGTVNEDAIIYNSFPITSLESKNITGFGVPVQNTILIGDYNHVTYAKFDLSTFSPICSMLGSYLSFYNTSALEDITSGEFRVYDNQNGDQNLFYGSEQYPKMLESYSPVKPTFVNLGYAYLNDPLSDLYKRWKTPSSNDGFRITLYKAWNPSDFLSFVNVGLTAVNEKSYSLTPSQEQAITITPFNETYASIDVPVYLLPEGSSIFSFYGSFLGDVEFTGAITPQIVLVFNDIAFFHTIINSEIFDIEFNIEAAIPPYLNGFIQDKSTGFNKLEVYLYGANFTSSSSLDFQFAPIIAKLTNSCNSVPIPVTATATATPAISVSPTRSPAPANNPDVSASVSPTISISPFPSPFLYIPPVDPSPFPTSNPSPVIAPTPSASPNGFFPPPPPGSPSPRITTCLTCVPIPTAIPVPSNAPGVVTFPVTDIGGGIIANVSIPNTNLPPGGNVFIRPTIQTNPNIISSSFDITIVDQFGNEVQLTSDAEICLEVFDDTQKSKSCLSYLDEEANPPEWKCQDKCLKQKDSSFCGKTTHFTSFAILLTGSAGECDNNHERYIFDASWKDGLLIALTAGFIICALCIFAVIILVVPCSDRIILGKEGSRVKKLRLKSSTIAMNNTGLNDSGEEAEEIV